MAYRFIAANAAKAGLNAAGTPMVTLWASSKRLAVYRIKAIQVGGTVATNPTDFYVVRSTARGTPSISVTPSPIDAADQSSGAVLDTAWTIGGTNNAASTALQWIRAPAALGSGWVDDMNEVDALQVPSGAGITILNNAATGAATGLFVFEFLWWE